ncbi:MAG: flagellar motor switch protein FliN [Terriglobales bacterium]|jgi:flagellar motor switch protein FliN/FliY
MTIAQQNQISPNQISPNHVSQGNAPNPPGPPSARDPRPELSQWCEAWKTCFEKVLTQISGTASGSAATQPAAFETAPQPLALADSDAWFAVVAGGAVHGEMTLRLPAASGTRLARTFLGEPEPPTEVAPDPPIAADDITADNHEALEELLRQIAGLAATAVAALVGGAVQLRLAAAVPPSWSSDSIVCFQTRTQAESRPPITFEIRISPALTADILARAPKAQSSPLPSTGSAPAASYDRLMDVGLDVKLRFGTRRMLLRDVLALSAGVVVELDNPLHSPVDLLLDNRLIAQGEVVVVDGKYGLRVTNVVDRAPGTGSPV